MINQSPPLKSNIAVVVDVDSSQVDVLLDKIDRRLHLAGLLFQWEWDEENHAYVDPDTGEVIEHDTLIEYRNDITMGAADIHARYPLEEDEDPDDTNWAALLLLGLISLTAWELGMRQAITATVTLQYTLGRGGFANMADQDWGWVDEILLTQFQFLNAFSIAISLGELSEQQIAARSRLYLSSTVQAFEIGRSKSFDTDLSLTVWPGDGTSICLANDRCFWVIVERDDTIECTWHRTVLESCETCIGREACPAVVFVKATGEHKNMTCYETA
jgi:hypothetical protein